MQPALSTRVFGDVPNARQLVLARHHGFYAIELWTDPLESADAATRRTLLQDVARTGLAVPCVHLPTRSSEGDLLDLSSLLPAIRRRAAEAHLRALDLAARLGARVAVLHASDETDELWEVSDAALVRQIGLAIEPGPPPDGPTVEECRDLAWGLGSGHGLCLDLSSDLPTSPETLRGEDWALRWLEVSGVRAGVRHQLPDESDVDLLPFVEAAQQLPFAAYEIAAHGRPGLGELDLLLRRTMAWHRQEYAEKYVGGSPFLPLG